MSKFFESCCSSGKDINFQPEDFSLASVLKAEETALSVGDKNEADKEEVEYTEGVFPNLQFDVCNSSVTNVKEEETELIYKALSVLGRTFIKTIPRIIDAVAEIIADSK